MWLELEVLKNNLPDASKQKLGLKLIAYNIVERCGHLPDASKQKLGLKRPSVTVMTAGEETSRCIQIETRIETTSEDFETTEAIKLPDASNQKLGLKLGQL